MLPRCENRDWIKTKEKPPAPGTDELERARKACTRYKGDLETVIRELENDLAIAEAAPRTPIERAAREAVQDLIVTCNTVELHGGEDVLITYLRPQLEKIRAALSGLPQEQAPKGWTALE